MIKFLQKIFKLVAYSFFIQIYGKIEKSIACRNDSRIKVKFVNTEKDLRYKVYKITGGRLYTDRIQDTAVILDNQIVEEPSFQLRNNNNSNIKNNIVFKKGTPRKLRNLNGTVLSLLTGGGGNNNYWHWLFDVLPRFGLCSKVVNLNEIDFFLLPNLLKKFQNETLDCLNIPKHKRFSSEKFRHIKARELIVTDHPWYITGDAAVDNNDQPNWIAGWLRDNFINSNMVTEVKEKKKIYIDRSIKTNQPIQRLIGNEDTVKGELLKNNFIPVKLHEISFREQVNLFYNAKCVVGLHGAGFANLVFCKSGTKVIELRSPSSGDSIKNISKKNNLNYDPIVVEAKQINKFNIPKQQGSIQIPINSLIKMVENQ